MWKRIIDKFLCLHRWESWTKVQDYQDYRTSTYTDILICKECGKIKIIKY